MNTTNKKLQIWLPLLFAIIMIVGMLAGYKIRENTPGNRSFLKSPAKRSSLQEVIDIINLKYVDAVGVDTLADDAITEMLTRLDPHSIYIPPSSLNEANEDLQGNFQGIGVEFQIFEDTVNITSVLPGGPSDKAGLQLGDKIVKVEDSLVAGNGITSARIKSLLRGPGGSRVNIAIARGAKLQPFVIERGTIPLPSVDAAYMAGKDIGYIRINKFSETTYEEFMKALEDLQAKGSNKLLLDLRGNGGGILGEAIDMADEFIDGNKLIVYTEGNKVGRENYRCKRNGLFEKGKLVVLVDENTASASEIVSGALQDWDRATLVGRRTFGKGLVQQQYDLSNKGGLRLTVARYYTPSGRSIQKPYSGKSDAYDEDIINRYHHGDMVNADSNKIQTGKVYKTKEGRAVYGGGGIMPDVFVAFDTSSLSNAITKLYAKSTMNNFAYRYYISHRDEFKKYRSPEEFSAKFETGGQVWDSFNGFAIKDSVSLIYLTPRDRQFVEQRIKALLARLIWRNEGFYEILNSNDSTFRRAMKIIQE